jgi:flagellar hook-length control protein FliK
MAPDSQATQGLAEISSSVGTELAGSPSAARSNSVDLSVALAELERSSGDESDRDALRARVSEAFASRMVAQVGRGHWSMLLELKPADLGSVSIEMSMQNGQLEAIFDAPSPAARALLADGLERLRQELEKSGMNVAHLGMQQFAGGSGGGKPTAGRFERKVEPDADEVNSPAETDPSMRASNTASERVLDVRV